jgi:hypothetical protein
MRYQFKALVVAVLLISFDSTIVYSQSTDIVTTAVPFLLISSSPEANGQGCTSVSRISDDPYAINYNPAHLGFSSAQTNVMFSFYPTKTDWLPGLGIKDLTYNSLALSGGINLEKYVSVPLSIGVAYSRVDLNLGTFNRISPISPNIAGTFTGKEHSDAFSIGVGVDIGIKLAMGLTFRNIESNFSDPGSEQGSSNASAWSHDYGLLINIPIADLACNKSEILSGVAPIFDLSFGSALTNVGEKMFYIDKAQADPLPRNISIGTAFEIGFKLTRIDNKLLTFTWSRQSDNLLVGRDATGHSDYLGGFGDLNFIKNIVGGKRTTRTVNGVSFATTDLSQGWQIGIAEMIYIRRGSFVGTGNRSFTTEGLGLRASGILKLLKGLEVDDSNVVSFIADHFDIRYDQSEYSATEIDNPLDNTKFSSVSVVVKL